MDSLYYCYCCPMDSKNEHGRTEMNRGYQNESYYRTSDATQQPQGSRFQTRSQTRNAEFSAQGHVDGRHTQERALSENANPITTQPTTSSSNPMSNQSRQLGPQPVEHKKEDIRDNQPSVHQPKNSRKRSLDTAIQPSQREIFLPKGRQTYSKRIELKVENKALTPEQKKALDSLNDIQAKAYPFITEINNFKELESSNKHYYIEQSLRRLVQKLDDLFDDMEPTPYLREERKNVYAFIFPLFDRLDEKVEENKQLIAIKRKRIEN